MTVHLLNSFSLSMVPAGVSLASIGVERVTPSLAREKLGSRFHSAVGHASTAAILESMLGVPVAVNRACVTLSAGDEAIVAQFSGARLPEGATSLPEGATLEFLRVRLLVLAEGPPFGTGITPGHLCEGGVHCPHGADSTHWAGGTQAD